MILTLVIENLHKYIGCIVDMHLSKKSNPKDVTNLFAQLTYMRNTPTPNLSVVTVRRHNH